MKDSWIFHIWKGIWWLWNLSLLPFLNMSLCSQIKNYLLTWWEKNNTSSKKSLACGNTQCLFCRITFNIDQEVSWKITNHPRYVNSASYLGIKWSGITLGSRTTRDHQRDLQLFLYFFCMILVEIYPCTSGSVIKNAWFLMHWS